MGAGLAADREEVTEAVGGDERGTRAAALEYGVRRDGGAVDDDVRGDAEVVEALKHGAAGIVRGGGTLVDAGGAVLPQQEVREGPAHVDAEESAHGSILAARS